jgi:hypothetical protein
MKSAKLTNPSRNTMQYTTSIEPWQRDAIRVLRADLGVDGDALIRAGLTLALCIVGANALDPADLKSDPPTQGA